MTSQERANHLLSLDQQARRMKLSDAAREEILAGATAEHSFHAPSERQPETSR